MEERRVTIRDIAGECGVHFTTVSRALSRHPSIPSKTCERISRKAQEMGYKPDPMLSAISAYRTRIRSRSYQGNIAWVTNYPEPEGWARHEIFRLHYEGALQRSDELGYRLEKFWLGDPEMNHVRAGQILQARNIRGLLLCAQPAAGVKLDLEWSRFSCVTFGYTLASPALHMVSGNTFQSIVKTIEQVRSLGYARIGFAISSSDDERIYNIWSGAFLAQQQHWPRSERIRMYSPTRLNEKGFLGWVRRYKPDAIIAHDQSLIEVLEAAGFRVPKDIGFATPSVRSDPRQPSGIDENPQEMGRVAVNMLVGMLQRNEMGIPDNTHCLLVKGTWHMGKTLRAKVSTSGAVKKTVRKP